MKNRAQNYFRIRGDKSGHYFNVLVFDNKAQMRKWYVEYAGIRGTEVTDLSFGAMVIPYEIRNSKTWELHKDIGTVIFAKSQIGAGTVAHEMAHCAFWHDRLINGNTKAEYGEEVTEAEERFCYLLTEFTRKTVNAFHRLGIYV